MPHYARRVILAFCVVAALGVSSNILADDDDDGEDGDFERARKLSESGQIVPLEKILDTTRTVLPKGKILEIEFKDRSGKYFYEIEVLDQAGTVKELVFDARSGRLLKTKLED